MSPQVIPVNVQVPSETTAPVVADLPVHALRVAYVAADLLRAGAELRLSQGGRLASATVSTSGELIVDGVAFASPSKSAATALGLQSSNGWAIWHVDDLSGRTLAQLRAKLDTAVGGANEAGS